MAYNIKIIGLKELRDNTAKYISQVEKGRSFVVVRRSKPIFKLTPVDEFGDEGSWENLVSFRGMPGGGMPIADFLKLLKNGQKR